MAVQRDERGDAQKTVLTRPPGEAVGRDHGDARHASGESLQRGRTAGQPLAAHVEGPGVPEEAREDGGHPQCDRGPKVGPRVLLVGRVPEHQAEVGDTEEDVEMVESFAGVRS